MEPKKVSLSSNYLPEQSGVNVEHLASALVDGSQLTAADWAEVANRIVPFLNAQGLKCGLAILDESLSNLKKLDALSDPSNEDTDGLSTFWQQQLKAKQSLLLQQLMQLPGQCDPQPMSCPSVQITPPEDLKKILNKILDRGTASHEHGLLLEACLNELQGTCLRLSDSLKAQPIGSTAVGFHTCFSCFDLCVIQTQKQTLLDEWTMAHGFLLQLLLAFLESNPRFKTMGTLLADWCQDVPIASLRFQHGLTVKVSFNTMEPVHHTLLLRQYALLDHRLRKLVVLVKLWAKFQGELPSYPLTLMVLYYMQVNPRVQLPVLNLASGDVAPSSWVCSLPLDELLCGFFCFYGMQYYWGSEVVSIRRGKRNSINDQAYSELREGAGFSLMYIEDPCMQGKNLSCVQGEAQEQTLQAKFKEIAECFMAGEVPGSFLMVLASLQFTEPPSSAASASSMDVVFQQAQAQVQAQAAFSAQAAMAHMQNYAAPMNPMFFSAANGLPGHSYFPEPHTQLPQAVVPQPEQQLPTAEEYNQAMVAKQAKNIERSAFRKERQQEAREGAHFKGSPTQSGSQSIAAASMPGSSVGVADTVHKEAREDGKKKRKPAKQTLSSSMQCLEHEDPDTVLIVRRINKLGFKAEQALTKHFQARFGPVRRVLLAHATSSRATVTKLRPSNLGFVQMKSAELALRILEQGETQEVEGCPILVQRFTRRMEGETEAGEDGVEDLEESHEASPQGFAYPMLLKDHEKSLKDDGNARSSKSSMGDGKYSDSTFATTSINESNSADTVSSSLVDSGGDSKSQSSDKSDKSSE